MDCPIASQAKRSPDATALIDNRCSWSYRELDSLVSGAAQKLTCIPGTRVAFVATSEITSVVLLFALFRLHAVACPLSTRLPLEALLQTAAAMRAQLVDPTAFFGSSGATLQSQLDLDQEATLLMTSGSMGKPKIASLSIGNYFCSASGSNTISQLGPSDCWQLSLPLYHVGGLAILFRCFLAGSAILISDILYDERATHLSLVPTQLYRLLKNSVPSRHLKMILLGGAPIPSSLLEEAQGLPIKTTYGMTEMTAQITQEGALLPHRELRLAADGELWVRGKTLFKGYWSEENGYTLPLDKEGWFPTKDLGVWTPDGKLVVIGRKDNLFISGGENIQPEEIEAALLSLPGIQQAVVVPISDEEFGARPTAFIYEEKRFYTLDQLRLALNEKLPRFKHPVKLFHLERPIEGKPRRRVLAQQAEEAAKAL